MNQGSKGGWSSIRYSFKVANAVGYRNFWRSLRSKNTCKTCAYGMGGQLGGMTNESGTYPEVCKKSIQAQLTDIQSEIPPHVFDRNSIGQLQKLQPIELERLGRLNHPLYKGAHDTHYRIVSWDDAIAVAAQRFKATDPNRTFFYSSGRSSNEAAFLLQLFARVYGTNNVNNCSYYCHQASGVGLSNTLGSGTATIQLTDLNKADFIFVIGANPASNHPRFLTELMHCRRRGGKVAVINPVQEPGLLKFTIPSDLRSMLGAGSEIASHYVQPVIGGDVALFKGIGKAVLEMQEIIDKDFINSRTTGFEQYAEDLREISWETIERTSRVSEGDIRMVSSLYASAENAVFSWCMGITHHRNGVDNVEEIVNLALLRGMLGRPGAGLLPLRGHSNVQGVGSMGVTPALKDAVMRNMKDVLGIEIPVVKGMDTMACMHAAAAGKIDAALMLGGNLYGSNPDSAGAAAALGRVPFKAFITTTLNQSHLYGTEGEIAIFPCSARDEEKQKTTQESMFNFVRMSDGGIVRLSNVRPESEIIAEMADLICGKDRLDFNAFRLHSDIRSAIASVIPGFEPLPALDGAGPEFQITGRTFHNPVFPTNDGKARFTVHAISSGADAVGDDDYLLMTVRSEGQFNTIIYDERDLFRDQVERWIVLMNPDDMNARKIRENDLADLRSETGVMEAVKVRPFNIARGCLLAYFPEANVLVSDEVDVRSRTPAFKAIRVRLEKRVVAGSC